MPRPKKCRKVCHLPAAREFHPSCSAKQTVVLTVDEYEAIRLIDKENFSQEECAGFMQVSRPTVQLIYNAARVKLAEALVCGFAVRIEGGDYTLCDGEEAHCSCAGCRKHQEKCARKERCVSI